MTCFDRSKKISTLHPTVHCTEGWSDLEFFRILKTMQGCQSGIFLGAQFRLRARQSFHFHKITGTLHIYIYF